MKQGTSGSPRHAVIREALRRRITREFLPGMRLPTELELFRSLNASSTTVVHALNDLVREGLIVRRRGCGTFVAERQHPPLIPGRNLKLGILWYHSVRASEWDSFCHRVAQGAMKAWGMGPEQQGQPELEEDRAGTFTRAVWRQPARGLTVECIGNEWGGLKRTPSLDVIKKSGYDGLLTLSIIEEQWLGELLALGLPTVVVDFPTQRFATQADLVYADPQSGYRAAVDHFVSKGLRRIHFVAAKIWDPHSEIPDRTRPSGFRYAKRVDPDSFLRLSAYRQAMDAHHLKAPESWVHQPPHIEDEKLSEHLASLPRSERPEAIVCRDVSQAECVVRDCLARGLRLEAAGACDRPHIGQALNIRLDSNQMGAVAGEQLLARLKQPERPYLNVGVRMAFVSPDVHAPRAAVRVQKT